MLGGPSLELNPARPNRQTSEKRRILTSLGLSAAATAGPLIRCSRCIQPSHSSMSSTDAVLSQKHNTGHLDGTTTKKTLNSDQDFKHRCHDVSRQLKVQSIFRSTEGGLFSLRLRQDPLIDMKFCIHRNFNKFTWGAMRCVYVLALTFCFCLWTTLIGVFCPHRKNHGFVSNHHVDVFINTVCLKYFAGIVDNH